MTEEIPKLPHHKLIAYGLARQLLRAVQEAQVADTTLRSQALRAAKSACLNCAEGAARVTRPDKARAFTIARGEAVEAAAAIEIASECGDTTREAWIGVWRIANELVAVLTGLIRPR